MSDILAFLDYTSSNLLNIALEVTSDFDEMPADIDVAGAPIDLEIFRGHGFEASEETLRCFCKMGVKFEVHVPMDGDDGAELTIARGSCAMTGSATCDLEQDDREMQERILAANTVSFLWAKMRDWIELVSQAGPLGRITLPAVDPFALLDDANAIAANEE